MDEIKGIKNNALPLLDDVHEDADKIIIELTGEDRYRNHRTQKGTNAGC